MNGNCGSRGEARAGVALAPYDPERLEELIRLWRESFEAGVGIVDPHPLSEQRQYFLDKVRVHCDVRLALLADTLTGFAAASNEPTWRLDDVKYQWRRSGEGNGYHETLR